MSDSNDPLKGIRSREIRIFFLLYPVFRKYLKDRRSARRDEEKSWSYVRERVNSKLDKICKVANMEDSGIFKVVDFYQEE